MKESIQTACGRMGIAIDDSAAESMAAYWVRVLETNKTLNLTRIVEQEQAAWLHFADSLAPLLYGESILPIGARALDIGTGAGFPGVPLLLARKDLQMTLIDARRKRADFVRGALEEIGSTATVLHSRAEDMPKGQYDVVFARAVAPVEELAELALPRLSRGGVAILWKGPSAFVEMERAQAKIDALGGQFLMPNEYELMGMERTHWLVPVRWK